MSLESTQKVMQLLTQDWSMSLQEKDGRLEAIEYRRMPDGVIDWSVGIIDGRVTLVLAIQEGSKPTVVDGEEHFVFNFGPENKAFLISLLAYHHLAFAFKDPNFFKDVLDGSLAKLRELIDSQRPLT